MCFQRQYVVKVPKIKVLQSSVNISPATIEESSLVTSCCSTSCFSNFSLTFKSISSLHRKFLYFSFLFFFFLFIIPEISSNCSRPNKTFVPSGRTSNANRGGEFFGKLAINAFTITIAALLAIPAEDWLRHRVPFRP